MKLTEELWKDSQKNELYFWKKELEQNNLDQRQRNAYYLSKMEGKCDMIKRFLDKYDISDKVILDLGSGPMGICHVLNARLKIAVDPLMNQFKELGYDIYSNNVQAWDAKAESLEEYFETPIIYEGKIVNERPDVIFCLNSIDHHQDPQLVVDQCYKSLKKGGHLILLTDTRLPEQCDAYHKLPLTQDYILSWLGRFLVEETQEFPHGPGNPIMQFIVHAIKEG